MLEPPHNTQSALVELELDWLGVDIVVLSEVCLGGQEELDTLSTSMGEDRGSYPIYRHEDSGHTCWSI
ncbi:hypothetical protein BgiBS90_007846 [Biomphalaria glabrata]|nr:hypothetical protein BgiBS90_007846 [Biomphalaria glabrata]